MLCKARRGGGWRGAGQAGRGAGRRLGAGSISRSHHSRHCSHCSHRSTADGTGQHAAQPLHRVPGRHIQHTLPQPTAQPTAVARVGADRQQAVAAPAGRGRRHARRRFRAGARCAWPPCAQAGVRCARRERQRVHNPRASRLWQLCPGTHGPGETAAVPLGSPSAPAFSCLIPLCYPWQRCSKLKSATPATARRASSR